MLSRTLLIAAVAVVVSGCSDQRIESSWAVSNPTIDGSLEEWGVASLVTFEDLQVSAAVRNDSSFLYLAGRIGEGALRRMVRQSGVTIWLDPEGEHHKDLQFQFPAEPGVTATLERGGFWEALTTEQKESARKQLDEMHRGVLVIDERSGNSVVYKPGNVEGIEGKIGEAQGFVSFEARIPMRIENYFPAFRGMTPGKKVRICLVIGSSSADGSRGTVLNGAPPAGGLGPPGRGGPPGAIPGGGDRMPEKREIWLEVNLARPQ